MCHIFGDKLRVGLERESARFKKQAASGCGGMWDDIARSLVTTTRTSVLKGFENVLDSDESWLGLTWGG